MPKRNIHRNSPAIEPDHVAGGKKRDDNNNDNNGGDNDDDIPRPRGYTMSYGAAWYKVQTQWKISVLERKKKKRKEQFGHDYLKLTKKKNYHYKKNARGEERGRANHDDDDPRHDDNPDSAQAREVFRDAMYDILSYSNAIQQCRADLKARILQDIERKKSIGSKRQQPSVNKEKTQPSRSGGDLQLPPQGGTANSSGRGGRGRGGAGGGDGRGRGGRGGRGRGRGRGQGSHIKSPGRLPKQVVQLSTVAVADEVVVVLVVVTAGDEEEEAVVVAEDHTSRVPAGCPNK